MVVIMPFAGMTKRQMKHSSRYLFILSLLSFSTPSWALSDKIYKELDSLTRIIEIVDGQYVEEVDEHKLIQGAIRGMLETLDPHTIYLPPQMYKEFRSDTTGKFGGVGIEITVKDEILTVVSPIEDTPAFKAGIKPGDRIVKIDGKITKGMNLMDAVHLMRGSKGKKVLLTIWREGYSKPLDIAIVRDIIKVDSVKSEALEDGYAYIRITSFQDNTSDHVRRELKKIEDKQGPVKGILLDLRNDPGGLLTEAIKVSDIFLSSGRIVSTKGRDQKEEVKVASKNSDYETIPVVTMINHGSASASEIVAGALQDTHRAKIVGLTSFGKGSVQTILDMGDRDALKITIAKYYTPKGRSIDGKGIVPDIELGPDQLKKDYPKKKGEAKEEEVVVKNENVLPDEDEDKGSGRPALADYQRQKALEILKRM